MKHGAHEAAVSGGERRHKWLRRIASAMGVCVLGTGSFLVWDSIDTNANEPFIGPKMHWVDKGNADIPAQSCVGAKAIAITGSSMGMDVAGYMGRNIVNEANKHNACVLAIEMGTYYTDSMPHEIAQEIVNYVDAVNAPGYTMPVLFWGESWGSNMLQRVINDKVLKEAGNIDVVGLVMESAPSGEESVNPFFARPLLELSKLGLKPGRRTLGALGMIGMFATKDDATTSLSKRIEVAKINNDKTSPRLFNDAARDIAINGSPIPLDNTDNAEPIFAIKWAGDIVVNEEIAIPAIRSRANGPFTVITISGDDRVPGNHAGCWLSLYQQKCESVMAGILDDTLPAAA